MSASLSPVHLGHGRIVSGRQVGASWDGVLCVVADVSGFHWNSCVQGTAIVGWQGTGGTGAGVGGGTAGPKQFVG